MPLTLAEAAQATGLNRSTILRAIKRGAISGVREERGAWSVEPVELHRVFPRTAAVPKATPQDAHVDVLIAELRTQLTEMRQQRDAWRDVAERLARRVLAGWEDMQPELREAIKRALSS
jgi:DNA-binding transcriptional MocR family regulator